MTVTRIRPPRREATWGDLLAILEAVVCVAAWFGGFALALLLPDPWVRMLVPVMFGVGRWTGRVKRIMDVRLAELGGAP